jgi:hypothetical protein
MKADFGGVDCSECLHFRRRLLSNSSSARYESGKALGAEELSLRPGTLA